MSNSTYSCHDNVMDRHESLLLREQYLCQTNTALPNSPGYPVQGTMNKKTV